MTTIKRFITCLLLLSTSIISAQKLASGPQVLTFFSDSDDTEQPYGLYLPPNYDEKKKYPLVVMLHGAGSNHRLSLRRVFGKSNAAGETDVEATRYFPQWKDVEYIVVSPYARGTAGYQGIVEKDVMDILKDVKKRFSIDEDRTYLTGLSMGGGGTLWIGLTHPDIWAAIAPVCPAPPKGTDDLLANAFNLPAHFFHGDADPAVPVTVSRDWVKKLKDQKGSTVEYNEYPGVQHNSWENAYKDEFIFDWFSKFKRNSFPDEVRFNSRAYQYNTAYWVKLDQLTPGVLATIIAKFTDVNSLQITTASLNAFTLKLKDHSKFKADLPLQININGSKLKATTGDSISFVLQAGKWQVKKHVATGDEKQRGAEGPLSAAFASRHIYVYGTAGNPTEEELKARMDLAYQAANWSMYRNAFLGRIMFFPRIVADKDVRPSDIQSSNLILFGTSETNTLIQSYSDRLPLHLHPELAKDHGLLYVFPMNGHYVVINSGLPWWTGLVRQDYPQSSRYSALGGFKDYFLFKESARTPIMEGYFDDHWKVPQSDVERISSVATVK